jgi:hypothetical protein
MTAGEELRWDAPVDEQLLTELLKGLPLAEQLKAAILDPDPHTLLRVAFRLGRIYEQLARERRRREQQLSICHLCGGSGDVPAR